MSININYANCPFLVPITVDQGRPRIIKDPNILKDTSKCLAAFTSRQYPADSLSIIPNDPIYEIYKQYLQADDKKSLAVLGTTCRRFYLLEVSFVQSIVQNIQLEKSCPKLYMIDKKTLRKDPTDSPLKIDVLKLLKLIKAYEKIAPKVENNGALTLLVLRQGIPASQIVHGKRFSCLGEFLDTIQAITINDTCIGLMTNHVIEGTRNQTVYKQQSFLQELGCTMPSLDMYLAVCSEPDGNTYPHNHTLNTYGTSSTQHYDEEEGIFHIVAGSCQTEPQTFAVMGCKPHNKSKAQGTGAWKEL